MDRVCKRILRRFEREGSKIVIVDEIWIRLKTPETKQRSTMLCQLVDTESVSCSMGNVLKKILTVPGLHRQITVK